LDAGLRRSHEKRINRETPINPSSRRRPGSRFFKVLDVDLRRHDDTRTNQNILTGLLSVLALCLLLGAGSVAHAGVTLEAFKFDTPAEELHFKKLIEELRCLVCQNQSLVDSDAELAHDLRAEVYEMVQDGKTDAEIVDFLVARYGEFVLYNPPVKPSNYLIWFGPFVLLVIAAILLLRAVRRQKNTPAPEITPAERARLDAVLGAAPPEQDKQQ
jgi:cytochrome c-type biogenesis protein CcmH